MSDKDGLQDLMYKMLNGEMDDFAHMSPSDNSRSPQTREERIEAHLEAVRETESRATRVMGTRDSVRKLSSLSVPDISNLNPIGVSKLEPSRVPYKGRVLFCTIITPPLLLSSAMTLVEDMNGDIANLAVYNMIKAERKLYVGRKIAVLEPFYKIRADGTPGIRVDNPYEIKFDVDQPPTQEPMMAVSSVEQSTTEQTAANTSEDEGAPTIPDRRPEMHRITIDPTVLLYRNEGNAACRAQRYDEADKHYTLALKAAKKSMTEPEGEVQDSVALWTLYSNLSMCRMKIGKPDLALKDAIMSHTCAPSNVARPFLRCVQSLAALGWRSEALAILDASSDTYTNDRAMIVEVQRKLGSIKSLRVGPGQQYKSIKAAVFAAPPGAEILVEAGLYSEPLVLWKPVTLRSVAPALEDLVPIDSISGDWAEIRVQWAPAVTVAVRGDEKEPVQLIGFRIVCGAPLMNSLQAVTVAEHSVCVLRACKVSSSSGPAIAVLTGGRIIAEKCSIYDSSQGGILACDGGTLVLKGVDICYNAANGLELRTGGSAAMDSCSVFANGAQGVLVWKDAGDFEAKESEIHSHRAESGVLVMENSSSIANFRDCEMYSNDGAGIAIQTKGRARIVNCKVRDNLEGILIQSSSAVVVKNCEVSNNNANGIFVGYDHNGTATIVNNNVHDNQFKGIILGNGQRDRVKVEDNIERGNRGMPPLLPSAVMSRQHGVTSVDLRKWAKTVKKTGIPSSISTDEESTPASLLEALMEEKIRDGGVPMADLVLGCAFCRKQPEEGVKFKKCGKCQAICYCSKDCQVKHWKAGHKKRCSPRPAKHPAFVDRNMSV